MPHTISLVRVLRAPPERVFRAFVTPDAMVKWLPPHGFTAQALQMDARAGGRWRMAFTNFSGGGSHAFGGEYLEVEPGERLRYTSRFDDPGLPGDMVTTLRFEAVAGGTRLHVEQAGIPDVIPGAMCQLGWQESLALLALLVEPDIPAEA
jgi:uncharacterized protein YndB with AHSA1/START domain